MGVSASILCLPIHFLSIALIVTKMIPYSCHTLVTNSFLTSRLPIEDVLWALNENIPQAEDNVTVFQEYHVDQMWEYMHLCHPRWHSFALALKDDDHPRIGHAVRRFWNGCLREWMCAHDEKEVTFDTLMKTYGSIADSPHFGMEDTGLEGDDDESKAYQRGDEIVVNGPDGEFVGEKMSALDSEDFRADLDEERVREIRYEDDWL
jgi:hypothetical protein